jgi:hypothetical protein
MHVADLLDSIIIVGYEVKILVAMAGWRGLPLDYLYVIFI